MKNIKENAIVRFVVALLIVGFITGLLFYLLYRPDVMNEIVEFKNLSGHQNIYLHSIFLISAAFILSITVVGLPILAFILFYEGMSIGFTLAAFLSAYSFKGLLFYVLFSIVTKMILLTAFLYFVIVSISYVFKFLDGLISKNNEGIMRAIVKELYRFLIVLGVIILNATIVTLIGDKLIGLFLGLIR